MEVKGDFDKTFRSKAIVSAQETMIVLANIDGSLKRDSNDCLVKDMEKTEIRQRLDVRNIFESSALVKVGISVI